jgi:hypothetical protein
MRVDRMPLILFLPAATLIALAQSISLMKGEP